MGGHQKRWPSFRMTQRRRQCGVRSPFLCSQPACSPPCQNSIPAAETGTGGGAEGAEPAALFVADEPDCGGNK